MRQMMSLGGFVFSLSEGTPYEGLQRTSETAVVARGHKPMSSTNAQQACLDDFIKSQRQGNSITLDTLID